MDDGATLVMGGGRPAFVPAGGVLPWESEEQLETSLEQKVIHPRLRDPEAAPARTLGGPQS